MTQRVLAAVVAFALVCSPVLIALAKPIEVEVAKIVIAEADGSLTTSINVESGRKLDQHLTLDHTQTLKVRFIVPCLFSVVRRCFQTFPF